MKSYLLAMVVGLAVPFAVVPAIAQPADLPFTGADIDAATFTGGDLPPGRSALTAKVQILLDRAGTSPGVTDGYKGAMSTSAIKAFERRMGLPVDGVLDAAVWAALQPFADAPPTQEYTITQADFADLVTEIPTDYLQKANMIYLGYTSVVEKLGERFHMDDRFIEFLNPGVSFEPGATITVMAPGKPAKGTVTRILIDKETRRVTGYDAKGRMLVDYPATIGSASTPSPSGHVKVTATALNPEYTYNPSINFQQGDNKQVLTIPPGPNGPVGTVWIALSKPTYGIHGTPTPMQLFHNQSLGCVRLTNWDAQELAHMVRAGTTEVEFVEPGTKPSIIDDKAQDAVAAVSGPLTKSVRPPMPSAALQMRATVQADEAAPQDGADGGRQPVSASAAAADATQAEAAITAHTARQAAAMAAGLHGLPPATDETLPAEPVAPDAGDATAHSGTSPVEEAAQIVADPLAAAIKAATLSDRAEGAAILPDPVPGAADVIRRPPRRPLSVVN